MSGGIVRELVTLWGFKIDKQPLKELDAGINTIKSSLKAVGIATAATAGAIGFLLNEAGKQEQTNVAFETILGGAEAAQKAIADLQQFASNTPFTIPGIEQNAKQLLAVGIESDNLIPTLKALGDVSAGLSVPLERIALNYGQIRTQNKLTGRELRDFAVAGVPLLAELAKQFGVTEEAVTGMVSNGQVGFKDVEKAFQTMTSEGGKFANLMDKQSKTFHGLISNAMDFGIILSRELGQEILPLAKEILNTFIDWLQTNRDLIKGKLIQFVKILVGFFKDLIGLVSTFSKALNGLVGVFGGWNKVLSVTFKMFTAIMGLGLLVGIGLITKALFGLVLAWKAMGMAALFAQLKMMLIPLAIGAIVTAIALIAEDVLAFSQGRDSVFGRMLEGITTIFGKVAEKFQSLGFIGKFLISVILTPIRMIINGFRSLMTVFDVLRGKMGIMDGIKEIFGNNLNTFGIGGGDGLKGALGLGQNIGAATSQASAGSGPPQSLAQKPFTDAEKAAMKAVNVQAENTVNLNVTGMNPEDAKDLVNGSITNQLGGMLRDTIRDGDSQIER